MNVNNHLANAALAADGKEIFPCIEGEPLVAKVPVYPGLAMEAVKGTRNESTIPNEGTVTYDIFFYVRLPYGELAKILINVEAQKAYNPGYDLVTRGVFYCARMLSSQKDTEFAGSDYDSIKKVYSIWICMDSLDYAENTITEYSMEPKALYGNFTGEARYDLLSVVMICLAKENGEGKRSRLHSMLETLLSDTMPVHKKLSSLQNDYGMKTTRKMETEMREMCNLSDRIAERGIKQGIEQGVQVLIRTCRKFGKTYEETLQTITEEFKLDEKSAQEDMQKYWKE